jgi:DNA-directed RNA polymerase beta subunit
MMTGRSRLKKKATCPICGNQKLEPIEISYASKLLMEELTALHILPTFILKNKYED